MSGFHGGTPFPLRRRQGLGASDVDAGPFTDSSKDAGITGVGPVPVPPGGVSPTRVLRGQFEPGAAPLPPSGGGAQPLGALVGPLAALTATVQALTKEVVALRAERKPPLPSNYAPPSHPSEDEVTFFSYLPPVNVKMWERYHRRAFSAVAPLSVPQVIATERTKPNEIVVLTDVRYYASRAVAGANPALMGQAELLGTVSFQLVVDGSRPWDYAQLFGLTGSKIEGIEFMQQSLDGFRPQFSVYIRPGGEIETRYTRTAAPTVSPQDLIVYLAGWTIPKADFQRALGRGSLF